MSLREDLNAAALERLCSVIQMPPQVTQRVCALAQSYDFAPAEAHYPSLFSVKTGDEAVKSLRGLLVPDDDGMLMLTVMLAGALRAFRQYRQQGIPEEIWVDTMKCFSRFVGENFESSGVYRFDRDFWAFRQLSMALFRIGTLEYEMRAYSGETIEAGGLTIREGDAILSLHIPSDAVLTRESLDESYGATKAFFGRYYPDFSYKCGWCHSWIISPHLKELLPAASKILVFQGDFILTKVDDDAQGYRSWLFKTSSADVTGYREDTSLQRRAKAHLLSGGKIGEAAGILRPGLL